MNQDTPRVSKHPRVSLIMVKTLSTQVLNHQESPQKIPEKPVDEEEKKGNEVDPASLGPDGALQFYSKKGELEGMRKAFQEGGKVNVPERGQVHLEGTPEANHPITGDYPLHMAAGGGHLDAVNELLTWEADIEAKNRIGSTPLLRAVSSEQLAVVKRLLKDGASIEVTNKMGNTALHCAAYVGSIDVARLLIEAQASAHITQANKFGATPLMIASKSSAPLAKYLLSFRPNRGGGSSSPSPYEEKKEIVEKRLSTPTQKEKRLSLKKQESEEEINSPSVQEQQQTRTIAAPSISADTRTIAAPSIGGASIGVDVELTTVSSTGSLDESSDDR